MPGQIANNLILKKAIKILPLVSVIVSTKNEEKNIENLLQSVKKQTYKNIEIILVDNNSTDRTKEIAKNFTKKIYNKGPERSTQRNFGVKKAKGDYVLILDADMILTKKVVEECVKKIYLNKNIKAIIIPEESFGEGFWAQCKKLERSFYINIDWMEAARFFEKNTFWKVDKFNEKMVSGEDWDLSQRIKQKYGPHSIDRIKELIYHNEQRLNLIKACKKKFYYSKKLDNYKSQQANFNNYKKQSNIILRYKLFIKRPKKLFQKPILGIGMLFMKTCELGFGGAGYIINKLRK